MYNKYYKQIKYKIKNRLTATLINHLPIRNAAIGTQRGRRQFIYLFIYLFRNFLMVREKRTKCPKTNTLANRANIAKNILYHKQTNNTNKQTENIYSARHACGTVWAQGASAPCLQGLG